MLVFMTPANKQTIQVSINIFGYNEFAQIGTYFGAIFSRPVIIVHARVMPE